jgi:hypothetical protein
MVGTVLFGMVFFCLFRFKRTFAELKATPRWKSSFSAAPLLPHHLGHPLHRLIGAGDGHPGTASASDPVLMGQDHSGGKEPGIDRFSRCIQWPETVVHFETA